MGEASQTPEIKERGVPPYRVSNGQKISIYYGNEQFSTVPTYERAIRILCDLTEYGKESQDVYAKPPYILDSTDIEVFSTGNAEDRLFLNSLDKAR